MMDIRMGHNLMGYSTNSTVMDRTGIGSFQTLSSGNAQGHGLAARQGKSRYVMLTEAVDVSTLIATWQAKL